MKQKEGFSATFSEIYQILGSHLETPLGSPAISSILETQNKKQLTPKRQLSNLQERFLIRGIVNALPFAAAKLQK